MGLSKDWMRQVKISEVKDKTIETSQYDNGNIFKSLTLKTKPTHHLYQHLKTEILVYEPKKIYAVSQYLYAENYKTLM